MPTIRAANSPPDDPFHLLFQNHPLPMWVYDLETLAFLTVNEAAVEKYGYSREEFLALTIKDIRPPEDVSRLLADIAQERLSLQQTGLWRHRRKDGSLIAVEITSHTLEFDGRQAVLVAAQDVTERVRAEEQIRNLNRTLNMLSDINQAIVRVRDLPTLLLRACHIAVEQGGFSMAWIGLVDETTHALKAVAHAGTSDEHLQGLNGVLSGAGHDQTLAARALVTNQHVIVNDIAQDTGVTARREEAQQRGYRSAAAFPLSINNRTQGTFNHASTPDFFDDGELRLLDELAADIAFALEFAEQEEKRKQAEVALSVAEANYRSIVENAVEGIFQSTPHGRFRSVNPAMARMYGYGSPAEMVAAVTNISQDVHADPETRQRFTEQLRRDGVVKNFEACNVRKNGTLFWTRTNARTVLHENGEIDYYEGFVSDITERKQLENEALVSRDRLTSILNSITDAFITLDREWRITAVNAEAARINKKRPEEFIGRTHWEEWPASVGTQVERQYRKAMTEGVPVHFEHRYFVEEEYDVWLDIHAYPTDDGLALFYRDITERKRAEEALRESEALFSTQSSQLQTILDTLPEGVLVVDEKGQVLLANPAAVHHLALLAQQDSKNKQQPASNQMISQLAGLPLGELISPSSIHGNWHEIKAGAHTFEIIVRPMIDSETSQWLLVLKNITAEREQQHYQQIQDRLATVGQLAAGIAHDFNNIMGVIVLYAELLRSNSGLSERQQRQLDTIHKQAQHAASLIRQILDFSRRSILEKTTLDILPLVKELVKLLERTLPENIHLAMQYDHGVYMINGDPTRIQQALMNLAINARDAMPQGGTLTFTSTALSLSPDQTPPLPNMPVGEWLCLTVSDTGTGIAPEELDHIFEPFFTTKEPGKGTGLGLAQVYGIVKQHEGHIAVQTEKGIGTAFVLYLPLLATVQPNHPSTLSAPAVQGRGETILLVEDNPAIQAAVAETLDELGYRVLTATNGVQALTLLTAQTNSVHLVISDLVMPEMGGREFVEHLGAGYPGVKLIFMTGYAPEVGGYADLLRTGVGWIQKPFKLGDLAALVQRALAG